MSSPDLIKYCFSPLRAHRSPKHLRDSNDYEAMYIRLALQEQGKNPNDRRNNLKVFLHTLANAAMFETDKSTITSGPLQLETNSQPATRTFLDRRGL